MHSGSVVRKLAVFLMVMVLVAAPALFFYTWRLERIAVPETSSIVHIGENAKYYVIFCSRFSENPVGFPGHCFVIWTDKLPVTDLSKVESYGFFPTEYKDQFVSFFKDVPATLVSEPVSKNPKAMNFSVVAVVSPEVYEKSRNIIDRWKSKKFRLWSTDCVGFTKDVAQSVGLKTPDETNLYPQDFIKVLRELNKPEELINRKEVTLQY